jgi:hypothetical protein
LIRGPFVIENAVDSARPALRQPRPRDSVFADRGAPKVAKA